MASSGQQGSSNELPLVVLPRRRAPEFVDWAEQVRACADRYLSRLGCILFRGFGVREQPEFRSFAAAFGAPPLARSAVDVDEGQGAGQFAYARIQAQGWPLWRWLCCERSGTVGTRSWLADGREVFRQLPQALRARCVDRGLAYTREFEGWSAQRIGIERLTDLWASRGWTCERTRDGGLRVSQRGVAALPHPMTGELVWFNRAHACLATRESESLTLGPVQTEPRRGPPSCRVCYADGAPIEAAVLQEIRAVLGECAWSVDWEDGDILMLDNLLVSHAHAGGGSGPAPLYAGPCFSLPGEADRWRDGWVRM